ncbi:MAG: hypothetical protein V4548_07310 [Bacteroidota bacterium]
MKNILGLIIIIALVSCQKDVKNSVSNLSKKDFKVNFSKSDLVDTIFFSDVETTKFQDFAIANLLQKKYEKDSFCIASFRLDFMKNSKLIYSHKIQIKGFDQGSDWYGNFEFDSIYPSLKTVNVGYPACGYVWNHYLFDFNDNNETLVHQWQSMSDSGWGTWTKFIAGNNESFYCKTISYSPKDDNDDVGIEEDLDSIKFEKINKKWIKTYLTPKDSVYRKIEVSFDDFHKQK